MQNIEQLDELQLDVATVEFLDVVSRARSLKLSGGRVCLDDSWVNILLELLECA